MEIEVTIDFTDMTLVETDGNFPEVKEIMLSENSYDKWMIKSEATINSPFGEGFVSLNLYHTGVIYITKYIPSIGDVHYNPDVSALSAWAIDHAWNSVQPSKELAKDNVDFWKYYYDTNIVECDYYDDVFNRD
jgi:hypothetical protein